MLAAVLVLPLLFAACGAQNPDVPQGGAACASDWDCSLGGECVSRVCVCDPWFTGPSCAFLNLAPAEPDYGMQLPTYYSWGGRALPGDDGRFHGFFSLMCRHATLDEWTTKSASIHATSDKPEGPFQYDSMVIQPWSHNTAVTRNPADGKWLIYHVGNGVVDPSQWAPCYNNSDAKTEPIDVGEPVGLPGQGEAYIQYGDTPNGKFTAFNNNTGLYVNWTGSWTRSIAGNPAPYIFANGTVLMYFTAVPCPAGSGALASNCIAVARADQWNGTYQMMGARHPITYPESEDPSVFRDPRGNFHLLTNVNTCHARCPSGVQCGGHAWSRDGLVFSNLTIGAFGPVIRFSNGTYWHNAYIERPFVYTDETNTPVTFYGGLGRRSYSDSCSWAQPFCKAGQKGCGPTFPPPPPPPPPPMRIMNRGLCLVSNSSFPCTGTGGYEGCPVFLGSCASPAAAWTLTGTTIASAFFHGPVLDVDCNSCRPHTLVKLLISGASSLAFNAAAGQIEFLTCPGMCLNTGQGPPVPPCGPPGEQYLQTQIQLESCSNADTQGWSVVPAI